MKIIDRMAIISGMVCFTLFFISIEAVAQKTDFSGIWLLKERVSISGVTPENGVPKVLRINPKPDSIIIERLNIDGGRKEYTLIERSGLNGVPITIDRPGNRKRVSSIKWSNDQKSITQTVKYYKSNSESQIEYTYTEFWSISDSTKMLTVERSQQNSNGEKWAMRGIYERKTQDELTIETAKGQGTQFEDGSNWENIKAKAKQEHKYIFVDCFATWCGPCKKMDMEVYPLNRVGDYMNNKFISMKLQMDTTQKDDEQTRNRYTTAHKFMQDFNIIGFPTFLFFSPNGEIVHKAIGYYRPEEFINLITDALDPAKQYFSLLRDYRSGRKDYTNMNSLALKARELGDNELAERIAIDYKIDFLDKLMIDELCSMKYLDVIKQFYNTYLKIESSKNGLFKLFYDHGNKVDSLVKFSRFTSYYIKAVITREEIDAKLNVVGGKPDWAKMQKAIKDKYPKIDADLLILAAQVKYYGKRKDWNNQVKYFVREVERYGPSVLVDANGYPAAEDAIEEVILLHCDDKRILNRAIGWIEELMKAEKYPVAFLYGAYGGLLYKAGRRKEGIDCLEKQLSAIGYKSTDDIDKDPRFRLKLEILEKMNRGEEINNTWSIEGF